MTAARATGLLLLLTAVATAVAVLTRLAGSEEPPADGLVRLPVILDTGVYAVAGAARVVSGLALLAAAMFLSRCLPEQNRLADVATGLLEASGIVTAASGACMLALAIMIPEGARAPDDTLTYVTPTARGVIDWVGSVDLTRWVAGKVGFTLAGLGLIALGPVQWRIGGLLKISAVADLVIGVAMLFIWVDAATVMHRVSGIAFLVWLIITGVWLAAGLLKSPPATESV